MMSNKMIDRYIKTFEESRQGWIDQLVKYPASTQAPQMILAINHKIELLETFRTYEDN